MSYRRFTLHVLASFVVLAVSAPAWAQVVIGTWEDSTDGWIDWSSGQAPIAEPKFTYSDVGVTHGSRSLQLDHPGWNQNLSIKLQDNGLVPDFMANTQFSIDVSVPASQAPEGWTQIYALAINAEGYGFVDQQPIPKHTFGFPNGDLQTATLTWEYGNLIADGSIPANPGWVELILATNNDSTHTTIYFDNARLVPEPGALAVLGLAATGFLRRRR